MGDEDQEADARRYGTVEGVFVPTLLTILGVILFLRTGWVVGNAGLLGALGIIAATFAIVGATALSLSSISTNVTPPPGGAYALVARSFGVEAGGAVGIPLYLSQTLVVVLYTFGFRDGWLMLFPGHPALVVDLGVCAVLVAVTLVSTRAAFRLQYLILAVVVGALVSVAVGVVLEPTAGPVALFGEYPGAPEDGFGGTDRWTVFAVFFPAATGIMAGLNLSGELRDPRRSIRRGTLAAVGCSLLVYVAVAVALAFLASPGELVADYFVLVDRAAWPPIVLAGLLAATFSSALASLVGAPRILQALAGHGLVPASAPLGRRNRRGEPRNALLLTIAIILAAVLAFRDLNAVAPLITLVFLLTYAAINLAVLVESVVGLPSYRPTFRVHWAVPLLGTLGCLAAMAVVDLLFTLVGIALVGGVLVWLGRRRLDRPFSDIRSGALLALSRWSRRKAAAIASSSERGWTPNLLVPVTDDHDLAQVTAWVDRLAPGAGMMRFAVLPGPDDGALVEQVRATAARLRHQGTDSAAVVVDGTAAGAGELAAVRAEANGDLTEAPNVVLARFPSDPAQDEPVRRLLREAHERDVGVVLLPACAPPDPPAEGIGQVALWVRGSGPGWEVGRNLPRSDLALLIAYHLTLDDRFDLVLVTAVAAAAETGPARAYLEEVVELARLPETTGTRTEVGPFPDALGAVTDTALNVLALPADVDFRRLREIRDRSAAPCVFVRDSGVENAFA